MSVLCSILIVGIGLSSAAIMHQMVHELPNKRQLRNSYQNSEPFILFTEMGDAVAVFPKSPTAMGLELAAVRSVDSLLQDDQ